MKRRSRDRVMTATLEHFYQHYAKELYHYARHYASPEDAEDLVQTFFLRLCERIAQGQDILLTLPYSRAGIRCLLVNFYRKQTLLSQFLSSEHLEDFAQREHEHHEKFSSTLENIIKTLPSSQAEILRLRYQEHFSDKTIAQRLDLSPKQVKHRKYRGVKAVREKMRITLSALH